MLADHSSAESIIVEQWKLASTELVTTVSRFFDLSIQLETQCASHNKDPDNLVTYIDSSLDILQTTIDSQLTQARVALANTRNRLTSSHTILSFPREVLSEIFLNVVYDRPHGILQMDRNVGLIYSRLHSLLGVCTAWRNVGLACGPLWSIVPIIDSISARPHPRPLSTELSLQRAGNSKGLYLAMSLTRDTCYDRPDTVLPYLSRFSAINIHEGIDSVFPMTVVLKMLLKNGAPPLLSKLSLQYSGRRPNQPIGQPTGPLNSWFTALEPQIIQLVQSLSVLRLNRIAIHWQDVVFSNRLVTLQVGGISLGFQLGIHAFISALASATELRDLRLVSIEAAPNQSEDTPAGILVLPKLENLHLDGLAYNVFSLFIRAISPKTYCLTVNFYHSATKGYFLLPSSVTYPVIATKDEIYTRLKAAHINKLVLNPERGSAWDSPADLQRLLESVPSVKTLVLNYVNLDKDILKALSCSLNAPSLGTQENAFPRLEAIEFQCYTTNCSLSCLRTEFENLLATHPIQCLVLSRDADDADDTEDRMALHSNDMDEEKDEMLRWLEAAIPRFSWLERQAIPPEMLDTWQLWDV